MSEQNKNLNNHPASDEDGNNEQADNENGQDNSAIGTEVEARVVEEQVEEILNSEKAEPEKKRAIKQLIISMRRTVHTGPLPDGETIEAYNRAIPNGGDRVMTMAEKQQGHRHEMEMIEERHRQEIERLSEEHRRVTEKGLLASRSTGQWMGFIIALAFLGASLWLIDGGHETAGITLMTFDICALVSIFVLGKYYKKNSKLSE